MKILVVAQSNPLTDCFLEEIKNIQGLYCDVVATISEAIERLQKNGFNFLLVGHGIDPWTIPFQYRKKSKLLTVGFTLQEKEHFSTVEYPTTSFTKEAFKKALSL